MRLGEPLFLESNKTTTDSTQRDSLCRVNRPPRFCVVRKGYCSEGFHSLCGKPRPNLLCGETVYLYRECWLSKGLKVCICFVIFPSLTTSCSTKLRVPWFSPTRPLFKCLLDFRTRTSY